MLVSASRRNNLYRKVRDREDAIANTRDACATRNPGAPASAEGRDSSRPGRAEARPSCRPSDRAVTALPFREIVNRRKQIFPREIRPQFWRHVHLGIRKLPEEKIGNPHLARGANQQVWIRIIQ